MKTILVDDEKIVDILVD